MKKPIADMLRQRSDAVRVRFHMPGHKGRLGFLPPEVLKYDLTELDGTDNLYQPCGVIAESQKLNAPALYARSAFYLVGGSSAGVVASLLCASIPGQKVLFARDMHLCAISGIALAGIKPVFVYPSAEGPALPAVVTADDFERAMAENPDARAVYLTYPNYYGICPDLKKIAALAHRRGMTVVVDAAHAAAFSFSELLPASPGEAGADIWTMSLHKTLAAPNQSAVLCAGGGSAPGENEVKRSINLVQTTSPSYLLLASIDEELARMREYGAGLLRQTVLLIEECIRRIEKLGGYRCVTKDIPRDIGAADRDFTRLVVDVTGRGMTGFTAEQKLNKKGIYIEGADHRNIIVLCSHANTRPDFEQLIRALDESAGTYFGAWDGMQAGCYRKTAQMSADMRHMLLQKIVRLPMQHAQGRIAACAAGTYPPGVPLLLPGQIIEKEDIDLLCALHRQGYTLFGCEGTMLDVADV